METLIEQRLPLSGRDLVVVQPDEAAEFPDDGPVEWAPLMPYWAVMWRSGVALGRELEAESEGLAGSRVVELGCGLGIPSLVAARAGATVLATDVSPDALGLVARSARENRVAVATARLDWRSLADLPAGSPFDVVLAADVLYEASAVPSLLALLPHLGREAWLADPGRAFAGAFVEQAARDWQITTTVRDAVDIHRLRTRPQRPVSSSATRRRPAGAAACRPRTGG